MTLIERIHREINSYKNLKDGWDGADSTAPTDETINNTIGLVDSLGDLLQLIDEDYIYATWDGTIVIDFQNDYDDLVSVEIGQNSVGYFFQTEGHIPIVDKYKVTEIGYLSDKLKSIIKEVKEK
jgi:hypothetical protein